MFLDRKNQILEYFCVTGAAIFLDADLLIIAANCPNLKRIVIDSDVYMDKVLWELFNKCEKLIDITYSSGDPSFESILPNEIKVALNKRKGMLSHILNSL